MNDSEIFRIEGLKSFEKVEKIVEDLFQELNWMNNDKNVADIIHLLVTRQHRTLQQTFFRVIFDVIKKYGHEETRFDLRNEDSVNNCKLVKEFLNKENKGYFSHV